MRRAACVLIVLLSLISAPSTLVAQQATSGGGSERQGSGFALEQNYPNPFNPETKIPFVLKEDLFKDGRPAVVSIRIYNVLQQYVASPTALNHPGGEGLPVISLEYSYPGRYEAYWDGRDRSGSQVASGVYFVQLVVNGRDQVIKMFVTK